MGNTHQTVHEIFVDAIGRGNQRFDLREDRVIVPENGVFIVPVYNLQSKEQENIEPIPTVSFAEFALKMTEGSDDKYIPCLVPDKDGDMEEVSMFVDYWIEETYFPSDEPRFTSEQRRQNKRIAAEALLNCIEERY